MESQSISLNKQIVSIDSLILDAVQDIMKDQSQVTSNVKLVCHNITKKGSIADHEDIMVYVDRGRICQVISNLIDNAFNFTKKGAITITKTIEDRSVVDCLQNLPPGLVWDCIFVKGLSKHMEVKYGEKTMLIRGLPFHLTCLQGCKGF